MAIYKSWFSAHRTEQSHQHSKSSDTGTATPPVSQSLPKIHRSSLNPCNLSTISLITAEPHLIKIRIYNPRNIHLNTSAMIGALCILIVVYIGEIILKSLDGSNDDNVNDK
jgi:hypothetical protein